MKKATKNWINTSEYDFKTANGLYKLRRYIYVIFMCHLSIEKLLKAIVSEKQNRLPPYTHNLVYLADIANISFPGKIKEFVELINTKSIPTRYPEDLHKLSKLILANTARQYLENTKEVLKWLKQNYLHMK